MKTLKKWIAWILIKIMGRKFAGKQVQRILNDPNRVNYISLDNYSDSED